MAIPVLSGLGNVISGTGAVLQRDAGHALNAGNNLISGYGLHAPATTPSGGYAPGTGPNSVGTQWVNAAHANPNDPGTFVNLSGQSAPTASATNTNVKNNTSTTPSSSSGGQVLGANTGSGTGAGTNPTTLAAINSAYDPNIQYYQNLLTTVPGQGDMATRDSNQYYDNQAKSLNDQFQSGNANLDQQTKVLNDSYNRSLQQLGNNIRNQFQGQINSLGIGGAGDSSAAQMSAYALANEQNMNRGYMNTDLNNQLDQIGLQRGSMNKGFNDQIQGLNDQKQSAYDQISQQYLNLKNQILGDIQSTQQAKEVAMMWTNNWAANQVAQVDQGIAAKANGILQQYSNLPNAQVQLNHAPTYQATAIQAPTVSAQAQTSQQVSPSAPLLAPGFNSNNNQSQTPLAAPTSLFTNNQNATNPVF